MSYGDETDGSIGISQREPADVESSHGCRRKQTGCRDSKPIIISQLGSCV